MPRFRFDPTLCLIALMQMTVVAAAIGWLSGPGLTDGARQQLSIAMATVILSLLAAVGLAFFFARLLIGLRQRPAPARRRTTLA